MEDLTDFSFRMMCKELGADLLYTEFASSEALIRGIDSALSKIRVTDAERPIGIQIYGGAEMSLARAAAIVEQAKPDFLDLNCGCWVKKIALREEGAGLLRNLGKFESVVKSVRRGTRLPVTVKTRLGWDATSIVILEVARMLEQCGVQALTVHCRTRDQGHKGPPDWSWLEKLKSAVSIPIIGNGGLYTPEDVKRMFETGCDGAMVGRGAFQNPWIFRQVKHYLATGEYLGPPTAEERVAACHKHLQFSIREKGERRAVIEFRKYYSGYLKGLPNAAKLRAELMSYLEFSGIRERLGRFVEECQAVRLPTEAARHA